ncbi:MAG TPA: hypothetical protein VFV69_05420, partial [Steroidobacteraceae bacterium]|nr:hypothetical protein [Steroidobacteraceae bacterium]
IDGADVDEGCLCGVCVDATTRWPPQRPFTPALKAYSSAAPTIQDAKVRKFGFRSLRSSISEF